MTLLETKLRTTGIDHTVLHVKDVAKSREFYVDVLGMTINHEDATHAFLWCGGGQMVALFQVGEGTDIKPGDDRDLLRRPRRAPAPNHVSGLGNPEICEWENSARETPHRRSSE